MLLALSFFLKIALATWKGFLCFHIFHMFFKWTVLAIKLLRYLDSIADILKDDITVNI